MNAAIPIAAVLAVRQLYYTYCVTPLNILCAVYSALFNHNMLPEYQQVLLVAECERGDDTF